MTDADPADSVARSVLGTKWKPRVISALATDGKLGFGALQQELDGISSKVLSSNLEDLLERDVIARDVVQEQPRRVEYELTAAGDALYAILERMIEWDEQYVEGAGLPTVLLAEDDPRLLEMYSLWLSTEYDVVTAENGRDALRALDESVDAAMLDRGMPGLTGDEVAAALKSIGQPTPIGFLTSMQVSPADASLPADRLLCKPVSKAKLHEAIEDLLGLDERSALARDVEARKHRLTFVERHLGSGVTGTDAYERARAELERVEADRKAALEEREPWRRYVESADDEHTTDEKQ
ncbi:winged helix-turn-helix transcriptional regulator [Halobiforma nitratireducens]|uniref:HxlR family transcriptional regulator n=1 Tax=Halobiforma nitratireducens JCM 10879 TaxID=1227454 RepID=M0LW60_9EURY|nr:winged helix-turn-helix transcriptional regulator [Halobiforma nitratireducens]EMA37822.1 HxlR family transcriptional regulator [Halobiforma nitratireducens JCM 10879]